MCVLSSAWTDAQALLSHGRQSLGSAALRMPRERDNVGMTGQAVELGPLIMQAVACPELAPAVSERVHKWRLRARHTVHVGRQAVTAPA